MDGVPSYDLTKLAKCLVIILFGIANIIWMDAPNNRLIGRLRRIILLTVAAESHPIRLTVKMLVITKAQIIHPSWMMFQVFQTKVLPKVSNHLSIAVLEFDARAASEMLQEHGGQTQLSSLHTLSRIFGQAITCDDAPQWKSAMSAEYQSPMKHNTWNLVPRT
jgi:hypothetical protein